MDTITYLNNILDSMNETELYFKQYISDGLKDSWDFYIWCASMVVIDIAFLEGKSKKPLKQQCTKYKFMLQNIVLYSKEHNHDEVKAKSNEILRTLDFVSHRINEILACYLE